MTAPTRLERTQLTHGGDGLESQHTYYDICPWSHDRRFIVYSSVPTDGEWTPFGHDTLACRDGRVKVIDVGTHHGTHPHPVWNQDGTRILYNSAETGHSEIYQLTMTR